MAQKIKVSASHSTPKNLSCNHYTTIGFGVPVPVYLQEVMPKTNISIKPSVFARAGAMYVPNLGAIDMNMHAFYVPFRLVWKHFDNFLAGKVSYTSAGPQRYKNVPMTNNYYLSSLFYNYSDLATAGSSFPCDLAYTSSGGSTTCLVLTTKGKFVYHLLSALGIKFNFVPNELKESTDTALESGPISLLPLMCYFKAFLDRYIPSQLQPSSPIHQFFEYINELSATNILQPIEHDRLHYLFDYVFLYYQRNYFTAGWEKPYTPITGLTSFDDAVTNYRETQNNSLTSDLTVQETQYHESNGVSRHTSANGLNYLNADGLTLIQKFNNLIKRLNYSGSRAIENLKSLFGVKAPELELGMSDYLGNFSTALNKTDVTVTGSNSEAGDMAGKAWFNSQEDKTFKCNCDYHGVVIVIASIQTPSTFVSGLRRSYKHIKPFDFYNPEFDGSLLQATSGSEMFSQLNFVNPLIAHDIVTLGLKNTDILSFVPRYCEYQMPLDNVSGDFDIPTLSSTINPYLLNREIVDKDQLYSDFESDPVTAELTDSCYAINDLQSKIDITDVIQAHDSYQFNRIFKDTTGEADPFICVFHFDVLAHTPQIPIDEVAEIKGRGQELYFEKNGNYVN